jgi:hypothetical protein
MKKIVTILLGIGIFLITQVTAFAGPPFNNLEGVGGVAFNPLAYLAGGAEDLAPNVGKPQFGAWYVNLNQADINWTSISVADSFFHRLEVSYGYQAVGQQNAPNHIKHNIGAKLLILPENFQDYKFIPAVSVGGIYKHTDKVLAGTKTDGWDVYLVASKLITQLPLPVLVSGGVLGTSSYATGALGYDSGLKSTLFGNIDVVLNKYFILGAEYKQGASLELIKNADYWDAHIAYTHNKNLTFIAAYTDTGSLTSGKLGLGDGVVLSAQYAF